MQVADFEGLPPKVQACALVGFYMGNFAAVEIVMDNIIGEILQVRDLQAAIVTRNMSFADKVKSLRALVDFVLVDENLKRESDKVLRGLLDLANERNFVAHSGFWPREGGGVQFAAYSANSKLKFLEGYSWSPAEAVARAALLMSKHDELALLHSVVVAQNGIRGGKVDDDLIMRALNLPSSDARSTD